MAIGISMHLAIISIFNLITWFQVTDQFWVGFNRAGTPRHLKVLNVASEFQNWNSLRGTKIVILCCNFTNHQTILETNTFPMCELTWEGNIKSIPWKQKLLMLLRPMLSGQIPYLELFQPPDTKIWNTKYEICKAHKFQKIGRGTYQSGVGAFLKSRRRIYQWKSLNLNFLSPYDMTTEDIEEFKLFAPFIIFIERWQ